MRFPEENIGPSQNRSVFEIKFQVVGPEYWGLEAGLGLDDLKRVFFFRIFFHNAGNQEAQGFQKGLRSEVTRFGILWKVFQQGEIGVGQIAFQHIADLFGSDLGEQFHLTVTLKVVSHRLRAGQCVGSLFKLLESQIVILQQECFSTVQLGNRNSSLFEYFQLGQHLNFGTIDPLQMRSHQEKQSSFAMKGLHFDTNIRGRTVLPEHRLLQKCTTPSPQNVGKDPQRIIIPVIRPRNPIGEKHIGLQVVPTQVKIPKRGLPDRRWIRGALFRNLGVIRR